MHFQTFEYLLEYASISKAVESYQEINAKLEEWGEEIPLDYINLKFQGFLGAGFKFILADYLTQEVLALFGDNGFKWSLEEHERNDNIIQYRLTKINKLCNPHEFSIVFLKKDKTLKPSAEHPDLIYGYAQHSPVPGTTRKIGVYLAVPSSGKNLLIKQGENVIDCGAYKFIYADRHVLENEYVTVSCSYIK